MQTPSHTVSKVLDQSQQQGLRLGLEWSHSTLEGTALSVRHGFVDLLKHSESAKTTQAPAVSMTPVSTPPALCYLQHMHLEKIWIFTACSTL